MNEAVHQFNISTSPLVGALLRDDVGGYGQLAGASNWCLRLLLLLLLLLTPWHANRSAAGIEVEVGGQLLRYELLLPYLTLHHCCCCC
jgi:hypothetical protein